MRWQPIETAPKDGSEILLHGKRCIAYGFFNGKSWVWPYIFAEPLFWMPLPESPNAPGKPTAANEPNEG